MTVAGFIVRNAFRNKRRLLLTLLSVGVSLFLFTLLQTALRELTQPAQTDDSALRIIVRHKVSVGNALPVRYKARIERIPGVRICSRFTWFGGIYKDPKDFFPQFAVDADKIADIFTEAQFDPQELAAFVKDRTGCIVGVKTMERFGWKVGEKITLQGTVWPCDPQLTIRGVYRGGIDETNLFFHHDYLDELCRRPGIVHMFWVRAENKECIPELIQRIDEIFANSDAETKTETERAFVLEFVSLIGNVKMLIGSICSVIVFTMILVAASTMSMAIRERTREIAILKAIGYGNWQIFSLILAESFALAVAGGFLGCFGAWFGTWWLLQHFNITAISNGMFVKFEVTPHIVAGGMLIAALLGIISCIVPAYTSLRTSVADGLKELD
ncbi:MAG: FtsX-like permease family protein [Verrucomicrobiae bacterium]|nr:FtsX-like permease family protein [Verrucomicrobiae bacterium]